MMKLSDAAREIPGGAEIAGAGSDPLIKGVRHDSRRVEPGDLFVARRGENADGTRFIADAIARGAVAILAETGALDAARFSVPILSCRDVADGLAFTAAAVYGHPSFTLDVIGITGTNGKTTTAHLVRAAIDGAVGKPSCGTIGTVGHKFGQLTIPAEHTTPEADEIARILAAMRAAGATYAAMEVSSIALALSRVRAVKFRVAAFTNLTQDHLDFHGTMENYGAAKKMLFAHGAAGAAVVHVGDPFGRTLADLVDAPLVRVAARADADARAKPDIYPKEVDTSKSGIHALLATPAGDLRISSRLVGMHNLENLVVALGVAHALELDLAAAARALGESDSAPGRLQRVDDEGDDIVVLVDYAHTPDALTRVLQAARVPDARLWCVFGCGGDRDKSKRPIMGHAVAEGADVAVITSDNPRSEDPRAIAAAVEDAVRAVGKMYIVELDRRAAIEQAVSQAAPGDVLVIAGKGHEDYQIVGSEKRHFDDREEARRALEMRRMARSDKARG